VYDSYNCTFENNEVYNCGSGIFIKDLVEADARGPFFIRNNILRNCLTGFAFHRAYGGAGEECWFYQNIIRNCSEEGILLWNFNDSTGPRSARLLNNTLYQNAVDVVVGFDDQNLYSAADHIFSNNICVDASTYPLYVASALNATKGVFDAEHNCYFDSGTFARVAGANISLSTWQSTYGQDAASPAALTSDPMFEDASSHDYRLQPGSPALTQGRDEFNISGLGAGATIPAGCYISGDDIIGRRAS